MINEILKKFDERFPQLCVVIKHDEPLDNVTSDVRNFISSSLKALLESLVSELEVEKLEAPDNGLAQWAEREKMGLNRGLTLAQDKIKIKYQQS